MEATIDGNQFRTAEGRVATIDLGRALGLDQPTKANEMVPDDQVETIMRLRTVPPGTAASAARRRGHDQLAEELERMGETSLQTTHKSALDSAEPDYSSTNNPENGAPKNPVRQMLHQKIEEYNISQNLERELLCFPELSHKLFGYSRTNTTTHRHNLESKGIKFEEKVRFPADTITGKKKTAGVSERQFFRILDRIDEEKADPEITQLVRQKQKFSNEVILNPEKLSSRQPQVTVEPQVNVDPNVHLDTEKLAGQIAEGIANELGGYLENGQSEHGTSLPGADMTPEEMREEIHNLLGPWKWRDDYNPWRALYNDVEDRRDFHVPIRQYFLRNMDTQNESQLDAAEVMHRDPNYPPALRVLLDSAREVFSE